MSYFVCVIQGEVGCWWVKILNLRKNTTNLNLTQKPILALTLILILALGEKPLTDS